jgi:hypothetical protein
LAWIDGDREGGLRALGRLYLDLNIAATAIFESRQRDVELALADRGAGASSIDCEGHSHEAGESAECTLGEVERGLAMQAHRRHFLAGDDQCILREYDAERVGTNARQVRNDFNRLGGLDDVDRWTVLRYRSRPGIVVPGEESLDLIAQTVELPTSIEIAPLEIDSGHGAILVPGPIAVE